MNKRIEEICFQLSLRYVCDLVEDKDYVAQVINVKNESLVLKVDHIDPHGIDLMILAKEMEKDVTFSVPAVLDRGLFDDGHEWMLMEKIDGVAPFVTTGSIADVAKIAEDIVTDYQKILAFYVVKNELPHAYASGKEAVVKNIEEWGRSLVVENYISQSVLETLTSDVLDLAESDKDVFLWAYGDIGNHNMICANEEVYLVDLRIAPKFGRLYGDVIRFYDHTYLKNDNYQEVYVEMMKYVEELLRSGVQRRELACVLAVRFIGIIGWDMLTNGKNRYEKNMQHKIALALPIIKRQVL